MTDQHSNNSLRARVDRAFRGFVFPSVVQIDSVEFRSEKGMRALLDVWKKDLQRFFCLALDMGIETEQQSSSAPTS